MPTVLNKHRRGGFTLIELMIVVAILGILAAIAIPAFLGYVRRSKTSEASINVNNMFKGASSFYLTEQADPGLAATMSEHCTVAERSDDVITPGDEKQKGAGYTPESEFGRIGFTLADYAYFTYKIMGSTERCGNAPNASLYTFRAEGDLDADTERSTFDLAAGSDNVNQLYHARGFHIRNENE